MQMELFEFIVSKSFYRQLKSHPSLCTIVGVMDLLLPWQHHSYKTLNIIRNVCYFDGIKL